ncbi:MAG TPA: EMC3/TMCO1 family protein [Candidatus Thermoplasmatota archaeon]|nr:EMC3/TMCO1 family protein [Candidatus Thermoplasmatota archaeon]
MADKKKGFFGTPFIILSFALVFLVLFDYPRGLRDGTAWVAGLILNPLIGFGGRWPLLTIFLASVVLVIATTAIRHFLTDWTKLARMQEAMRAFSKEMKDARKSNNTYKLKKLTEAQQDLMALQADAQTEQMKPMALTMLLVIPIFAWLGAWLASLAIDGALHFEAPWNDQWDIMAPYTWITGNPGWFPRWIVLYSLFGIPFGQIAQRALKLWEYRHVDLDGDGKAAGEA